MGVDFLTCDVCAHNFPDCGSYARCGKCGNKLCSQCMKNYVIIGEEEDSEEESTCPFCKLEIIDSEVLLEFALRQMGKSRAELEQEYRINDR